ncbi:sla2 Src-like adaptor 2 [Clydaea vesicula]|uniref:Sla2 Src-like adaptor 2 n=1 Tax=Clydaea vesicula TaxID=447962 RepID=A0AAD5U759_9FUNG|nr:sla2 Src-like adaptor 2 [Clydaea vesicula]
MNSGKRMTFSLHIVFNVIYSYNPEAYNTSSSRPNAQATEKGEQQLSEHIAKALSSEETAPKQKHVRACIIYTHDLKSSGTFFIGIKAAPSLGNDVISWKTLILFHKVLSQGHSSVLHDAQNEKYWLENLGRSVHGSRGYGILIQAYIQFILEKLKFHQRYPSFLGNFDYEEYLSLRGVEDPNEGYETIDDLIILLDKLDAFQKLIMQNLGHYNNECQIAALVPLLEESHGIYQFLVSMLTAMHMIIGSVEVLGPLREKFNQGHYALFQFYAQCSQIRYLATLIAIPKLSQSPPDFLSNGPPTKPAKAESKTPKKTFDQEKYMQDLERQRMEQERLDILEAERQSREMEQNREMQRQQDLQRQQLELQRQAELQRQQQELQAQLNAQRQAEFLRQQEEERMRTFNQQQQQHSMQQMEQQMLQQRYMELNRELENSRSQAFKDKSALDEAALVSIVLYCPFTKFGSENEATGKSNCANEFATFSKQCRKRRGYSIFTRFACYINKGVNLGVLDELKQWKQKYEALAKLYAQLRKEHLDLLTKFKDAKDSGGRVADEARKEVEKIRAEMRTKSNEITNILIEKDRLKLELERIRKQQNDELERLMKELSLAKESLVDISKNKGEEVQSIINRFTSEKSELERLSRAKDEDCQVLQSGLDQTLMALANLQKDAAETEGNLLSQLKKLQADQIKQLNRMMDSILQSCIVKIQDAVYELESTTHEGNTTASPEYVLSLLEKSQGACGDFALCFIKLVQVIELGGDQADAITASNAFAHSVSQLLHNAKGVSRLAPDDFIDELLGSARETARSSMNFIEKVKVPVMVTVESQRRPDYIQNLANQTFLSFSSVGTIVEKLVQTKVPVEDLEESVEKGMLSAARAIETAAKKLEQLMSRPKADLNVHGSILQAALAMTNAIANLIKCASASQQEIVQHGKGSSSVENFYKKNNKWSEGLISAAKAVAHATSYLVEGADGLVGGTHSVEQLIVAANEVGVATTQLVAAARVKAVPFSKTHDKLEDAAVLVRESCKLLVKAAKEASKSSGELKVNSEIKNLSSHQFKVVEMEQQVKILELEKSLSEARFKLAAIRKSGYSE